ncbi:MAG: hypothetical protein RLP14_02930 [Owenweeksia sp.]
MKKLLTVLSILSMLCTALAQSERGDTSYTVTYFKGIDQSGGATVCNDLEVKVDIKKEVPKWVREAVLKDLSEKLRPADIHEYPPEDSLYKTCENWNTHKIRLFSEILYWEPNDKMCLAFYVDEEDCCDPRKNKRRVHIRNVNLKNKTFYDLNAFYKKYKAQIDQDVMSHVRRKYRSNRERRYIRMIEIEEQPPLGFDKRGLMVFTVSTIGGNNQHVLWVVSHTRLPEPLPIQ